MEMREDRTLVNAAAVWLSLKLDALIGLSGGAVGVGAAALGEAGAHEFLFIMAQSQTGYSVKRL